MLLAVHNVFITPFHQQSVMFKAVCADLCCVPWSEIGLYVSAMLVNRTVSSTFGLQSVSLASLM